MVKKIGFILKQVIKREILKNLFYYLSFGIAGALFIILFASFSENRLFQFLVGTAFIVFYILWGIIHHFLEKDLCFKIVVEYILIGLLAFFLLKALLLP